MTWTHRGFEIRLDQHANFVADVQEVKVSERSLEEAKAKIELLIKQAKVKISLPVVFIRQKYGYHRETEPGEVCSSFLTGINRTTGDLQITLSEGYTHGHVLGQSDANYNLLEEYLKAKAVVAGLEAKIKALTLRYNGRRLEAADYPAEMERLKAEHALSSAGKPHNTSQ